MKSFSKECWRERNLYLDDWTIPSVWRGVAPSRAELLMWFIMRGRINTKSILKRLQIVSDDGVESRCLFCEEEEETIEHLFLHCNFSWKVWMDVLKWWNVFLPMAASHVNWFEALLGVLSGGFKGKLWITSCFVVFYSLWDQRNKLAFENKKMEWLELAYLIKMRVGFWMKGWCPSCPYSPIDLTRDVEAVCNWRLKHTSRTCVEWNKPPYNVWKWNVDGSSRGKPGAAGIGGLLRNHCGVLLLPSLLSRSVLEIQTKRSF
ncbi:hypothetical protein QL285_044338 [Trifolium repens]|nr:hypothetical protein QL285_044338 [Trifolium repens]